MTDAEFYSDLLEDVRYLLITDSRCTSKDTSCCLVSRWDGSEILSVMPGYQYCFRTWPRGRLNLNVLNPLGCLILEELMILKYLRTKDQHFSWNLKWCHTEFWIQLTSCEEMLITWFAKAPWWLHYLLCSEASVTLAGGHELKLFLVFFFISN